LRGLTLSDKRIVYTEADGRVTILVPAPQWLAGVTGRGGLITPEDRDEQIGRFQVPRAQLGPGMNAAQATYYVDCCISGGLDPEDAFALLAMKDVASGGTGVELWDASQVSADRWFRDAWRRSPEGGPIFIDLAEARKIQATKIVAAQRNKIRLYDDENATAALMGVGGNVLSFLIDAWRDLPLSQIGAALAAASTPDELRGILDLEAMEVDPTSILDWRLSA
tara:strand:- start:2138 stop:2806 length:669 start_codon:yes stop_codon:yes gene_type:complete